MYKNLLSYASPLPALVAQNITTNANAGNDSFSTYCMEVKTMSELTNPRQTILVTSRNMEEGKEKDNIITLDWHMPCSFSPLLYAISIGKTRYSCHMVQQSKCFCVNFLPKTLEKETLLCGRRSGQHFDKYHEANLSKEECEKIHCSRIKEAAGFMECEVINEIEAGDHMIFVGKVLASGQTKNEKRLFHITGDKFTTTLE